MVKCKFRRYNNIDKMNLPIKEWEETINGMSYEELSEYISDPDVCYPEFMELAKERLAELENLKESDVKAVTREFFLKALTEMECKYEVTEDGNVIFNYEYEDENDAGEIVTENKAFYVSVDNDEEIDSIALYYTHDINTNIRNEKELSHLGKVVNSANSFIDVNTVYNVDEATGKVSVYSWRAFAEISQMSNFKSQLHLAILSCLSAAYFVDISTQNDLEEDNNKG